MVYLLSSSKESFHKDKLAFIAAHDEISWENVTAGKDGTYGKAATNALIRSEERRVGKECRYRWSPYH